MTNRYAALLLAVTSLVCSTDPLYKHALGACSLCDQHHPLIVAQASTAASGRGLVPHETSFKLTALDNTTALDHLELLCLPWPTEQ